MIGKVQQDSFPCLRIRIEPESYEPAGGQLGYSPRSPIGESLLPRDCQDLLSWGESRSPGHQTPPPRHQPQPQQQSISRYKTELCRPYQEHGVCKYGEKCQFAHGQEDLRSVNRHPKYKTDMCRTYHSVGFCPYGPRCHFIHGLEELRLAPASTTPEKKTGTTPVKQLPMFGGNRTWSFNDNDNDMKQAVNQLNNFFNMSGSSNNSARRMLTSSGSSDSSRSGSFCSDLDSPTSASPPPDTVSSPPHNSRLRLPIFSKLA